MLSELLAVSVTYLCALSKVFRKAAFIVNWLHVHSLNYTSIHYYSFVLLVLFWQTFSVKENKFLYIGYLETCCAITGVCFYIHFV